VSRYSIQIRDRFWIEQNRLTAGYAPSRRRCAVSRCRLRFRSVPTLHDQLGPSLEAFQIERLFSVAHGAPIERGASRRRGDGGCSPNTGALSRSLGGRGGRAQSRGKTFWPRAIAAAPNFDRLVRLEGDGEHWRGPIWSFRSAAGGDSQVDVRGGTCAMAVPEPGAVVRRRDDRRIYSLPLLARNGHAVAR
jgi:hypothetical protein